MEESGIAYQEFDIKKDGREAFNSFYRESRSDIYRGEEGIEFPILGTGERIVQGVGMIIAFLKAEDQITDAVTRIKLSHGWISGLNISATKGSLSHDLIEIIVYLKTHGLKTQIETDGRNADILIRLIETKQIDRLIFNLRGPAELYESLTGVALSRAELCHSLSLVEQCPEYQIILSIAPVQRANNQIEYISLEEAGQAASLVEEATNKKSHPFYIREGLPSPEMVVEALPPSSLFKYRTACRRYMVKAEILKTK
jgi:pyruvate formate lyase activating enzyme